MGVYGRIYVIMKHTFDNRLQIPYWCRDWPGIRSILYPDQLERWGWDWDSLYVRRLGGVEQPTDLWAEITLNPNSDYHFLLSFQFTQSMRDTVISLPSREHVPGTGKNTYSIPIQDFYPTLEMVGLHERYIVSVDNRVLELVKKVEEEDKKIISLTEMSDEEIRELAQIKEIILNSKALSPGFKLFPFQEAGVAAMLYIFGVADQMEPGKSDIRTRQQISRRTADSAQSEFDELVSELIT